MGLQVPSCPMAPQPGPRLRRAAHRLRSGRARLQAMRTQLVEVLLYAFLSSMC